MTTKQITDPPAARPLRADAQRNRTRILEAAEAAFSASGTGASLDDIARQAGVGPGTLYRHFPSREDLIEALIKDNVSRLVELADELLQGNDPLEALQEWLQALVNHAAAYRGLAESLLDAHCGDSRLTEACHRQEAAAGRLFARAQEAGLIRSDTAVADVLNLVSAIASVAERRPDADNDRLLAFVLDGLRDS